MKVALRKTVCFSSVKDCRRDQRCWTKCKGRVKEKPKGGREMEQERESESEDDDGKRERWRPAQTVEYVYTKEGAGYAGEQFRADKERVAGSPLL